MTIFPIFVETVLNVASWATVFLNKIVSCLVCGKSAEGRIIHVCMSDNGESSKVITAYYPGPEKWEDDFKTRKEATK